MIRTTLSLRLTYHYAMGWRHLDRERDIGTCQITPRRKVAAGSQHGEGDVFIQHARVRPGLTGRDVRAALGNTMSSSRCRHEHDCCGCAFADVTVTQISKRDFVVRTAVRYNV